MKKCLSFIVLAISLSLLSGCVTLFPKKSSIQTEANSRNNIANVETKLSSNLVSRMDVISTLAFGTDYALEKVNDPSREVVVAKDINKRIMSVSGSPSLEKLKEMQLTIDNLISTLNNERKEGQQQLNAKDSEINRIQLETKQLNEAKDSEIRKYMALSQEIAARADAYKGELNKMDSFMGLGAIWYGIKKFIVGSAWILGITGVVFLLLRIFAASNPIAGAAFSIFNVIGGYVIKTINIIVPKALDAAGTVSKELYNKSTILLKKIVDNIQNIKEISRKTGKEITLRETLDELDKSLDGHEKDMITTLKKELGY